MMPLQQFYLSQTYCYLLGSMQQTCVYTSSFLLINTTHIFFFINKHSYIFVFSLLLTLVVCLIQEISIWIRAYNSNLIPTKMAFSGYDPERFIGTEHQTFNCLICLNVVVDPFECTSCGKLFCKVCISSWGQKNPVNKCPNRCAINNIIPIRSKALLRMYNNLDIKCSNAKCDKVLKLIDLAKHQSTCLIPKCWNFQVCQKPLNAGIKGAKPCCSETCLAIHELVQQFGNKKVMYEIIGKFMKTAKLTAPIVSKVGGTGVVGAVNVGGGSQLLGWDPAKVGGGVVLSQNNSHCFLKEQSYLFRSALTTEGFQGGVHYWQIIADSRTQNELKIGVTLTKDFEYNSAFCDYPFGFAYYGLGQLRHGSNASGPSYGKKFKKDGVLGVCLNMNSGVLAFSLNGEYMGVAYRDPKLTSGTIYPAVALLHCAGCQIRSNLPVPAYFKD